MATKQIFFAGDHNAGLHPHVFERLNKVNRGKVASYSEDEETKDMKKRFQEMIGKEVVTFTFNTGTAANVLGITTLTRPYHTVICARSAHIYTYEAGAPTRFAGVTMEALQTKDGKITIDQIECFLSKRTNENIYSQPKVVFITQPTEYGIVYSVKELTRLSQFCKSKGLCIFMDGARIANAVSKLNVDIKEITEDIGIDAFTWGGIKNGGLADVLVLLNPDLASGIQYVYKQFGQDAAKSSENDRFREGSQIWGKQGGQRHSEMGAPGQ